MTEDQIKHMVNRFLGWKLPENFFPDAGISFKPAYNEGSAYPMKHEPTGTNLFDANQAEAMVRYMAEGLPGAGAMSDFKQYRRVQLAEMRPYVPDEWMQEISVSREDAAAGSPKPGDMIARNPKNHRDQWLVAAAYFADNFAPYP